MILDTNNGERKNTVENRRLKIGFAFDRPSRIGEEQAVNSVEAEYEDEKTIQWFAIWYYRVYCGFLKWS